MHLSVRLTMHKTWFLVNNTEILKWPTNYPDSNPKGNLWGDLERRVYSNVRHFISSIVQKSFTVRDG